MAANGHGSEPILRAGPGGGHRSRLLGAEPRPKPERAPGGRARRHVRHESRRCSSGSDGATRASVGTTDSRRSSPTRRSRRSRSRPPSGPITGSRVARSRPGSTSSSRSRSRDRSKTRPTSSRSGAQARPHRDDGPHVPLQPRRQLDPRPDPEREVGNSVLHLDEPGQPRAPPERRQRRLGPRAARLLDSPLLAGREPRLGIGDRTQLRDPEPARCRVRQPRVRIRHDRACRALLACAEQAASHDDRRIGEDDRLRRHEQRARADLRLGRRLRARRRRSGSSSSRTARATSSRPTSRRPSRCSQRCWTSAAPSGRQRASVDGRARARGRSRHRRRRALARAGWRALCRSMARSAASPDRATAVCSHDAVTARARSDRFSIICLSQSSWDADLPTNRQQIMRRAAERGHRVLFVHTGAVPRSQGGRRHPPARQARRPDRRDPPRRAHGHALDPDRVNVFPWGRRYRLTNLLNNWLQRPDVKRVGAAAPGTVVLWIYDPCVGR